MPTRYRPSLAAHARALHYLARLDESPLPEAVRLDLIQTVEAYIGGGDLVAARRGVEWMRDQFREAGETPPF